MLYEPDQWISSVSSRRIVGGEEGRGEDRVGRGERGEKKGH